MKNEFEYVEINSLFCKIIIALRGRNVCCWIDMIYLI